MATKPITNPVYQMVADAQPKPRTDEKELLKRNLRLNALGQVFSLITQGIGASKGATITPMQDKYTPYALSEFDKMRKEEIAGDRWQAEWGLKDAMYNRKKQDDDAAYERKQKDANAMYDKRHADAVAKQEDDQAFQAEQNRLFRMTPDQAHKYEIEDILTRAKVAKESKESSTPKKRDDIVLTINDTDGALEFNANDVKNMYSAIMDNPQLKERVEKNSQGAYWNTQISGKDPGPVFMSTKVREMWPDLKRIYAGAPIGTRVESTQSAEAGKTTQSTTPEQKKLESDFNRAWSSPDPLTKKKPLLVKILVKTGNFTKEEAEQYINENYKGK